MLNCYKASRLQLTDLKCFLMRSVKILSAIGWWIWGHFCNVFCMMGLRIEPRTFRSCSKFCLTRPILWFLNAGSYIQPVHQLCLPVCSDASEERDGPGSTDGAVWPARAGPRHAAGGNDAVGPHAWRGSFLRPQPRWTRDLWLCMCA